MKTRIVGGRYRGRRLRVPAAARPTEQRVREALFSIWHERLQEARLLDLFAGSGAVGLEAAGRGARRVLLVESEPAALEALAQNRQLLDGSEVEIRCLTLPAGLARLRGDGEGPFDLVFADPPYGFRAYPELLRGMAGLLAPAGEAAIEHSARSELPERCGGLTRVEVRRYGDTAVSFYGWSGEGRVQAKISPTP